MRLHRFRLRTLMILVAVAGLLAWSIRLALIRRDYALRARVEVQLEQSSLAAAARAEGRAQFTRPPQMQQADWDRRVGMQRQLAARFRRWSTYHGALKEQYRYVASHPWLPIPPDPPEPK